MDVDVLVTDNCLDMAVKRKDEGGRIARGEKAHFMRGYHR